MVPARVKIRYSEVLLKPPPPEDCDVSAPVAEAVAVTATLGNEISLVDSEQDAMLLMADTPPRRARRISDRPQ